MTQAIAVYTRLISSFVSIVPPLSWHDDRPRRDSRGPGWSGTRAGRRSVSVAWQECREATASRTARFASSLRLERRARCGQECVTQKTEEQDDQTDGDCSGCVGRRNSGASHDARADFSAGWRDHANCCRVRGGQNASQRRMRGQNHHPPHPPGCPQVSAVAGGRLRAVSVKVTELASITWGIGASSRSLVLGRLSTASVPWLAP